MKNTYKIILGIILFYFLEFLERNCWFSFQMFIERPAIIRLLQGHHLANAGFSPLIYPLLQLVVLIFIGKNLINLTKNKKK
jgi:hypothetical protein